MKPKARRSWHTATHKPIIAVVGFNLLTLLVFATAPVEWITPNLFELYVLVLSCQLLILVGFHLGRRSGPGARPPSTSKLTSGDRLMDCFFASYASTFLIGYAYRTGFSMLDIAGMYGLLLEGVQNRNFGYEMALRGTGLGPIPWTVYFLVSISNQVFFIVGSFQWKRMNSVRKLLFVVFVCIELFFSIGRGTAFGVVSLATTCFLSSMLWASSTTEQRTPRVLSTLLLLSLLFLGSIAFFSYNLYRRSGNLEKRADQYEFGKSSVVGDHPALSIVPESLQPSYMNVVSYLGQGYYHTSLALDLEFESTWFLGSNPALMGLASILGIDVWDRTYMHRLEAEAGVDQFGTWHSAYTWYACDVSFYGVPCVLFFLAYLFGFSWAKSAQGDFLSKIMFVILGNMLLFLFANNTYLSTVFYSFMFLFPFWMFTRVSGLARAALNRRRASTSASASWRCSPMNAGTETSQ